jgi:hypothetical protein
MGRAILRLIRTCVSVSSFGGLFFLRPQNAYDMLEAKLRIARKVAKIKRYKSDQAA